MKRMTINDVPSFLQENAETVVLDVRTPGEYKDGHLAGAVNLPLGSLSEAKDRYSKKDPLLLYCYSGSRSRLGALLLKLRGFKNVQNVGGISDYTGELDKE